MSSNFESDNALDDELGKLVREAGKPEVERSASQIAAIEQAMIAKLAVHTPLVKWRSSLIKAKLRHLVLLAMAAGISGYVIIASVAPPRHNRDGQNKSDADKGGVTIGHDKSKPVGDRAIPQSDDQIPAELQVPKQFRVLTYNIHHGEGLDKKIDLERIASVIMKARPDIVALQEVDQNTGRSGGIDQAEMLGMLVGMQSSFDRTEDFDGGAKGNAVLTNLPVRSQQSVKLKRFMDAMPELAEQRCLMVLELGAENGPGLMFICTQLDYRTAAEERLNSIQTINEFAEKHADKPAILAGTLVAQPGGAGMRALANVWRIAGVNDDGTGPRAEGQGKNRKLQSLRSYPADNPWSWCNHICARPFDAWKVVEVQMLDDQVASSHRAILAVLRYLER